MENIDDYDMLDKDLEGSLQYARECYAAETVANDEWRDWDDRIRATAEILWTEASANESSGSRLSSEILRD
ncbi:hypothetical protein D3C76_335990 [compost metagenome]